MLFIRQPCPEAYGFGLGHGLEPINISFATDSPVIHGPNDGLDRAHGE